jgi:hypothetical protein
MNCTILILVITIIIIIVIFTTVYVLFYDVSVTYRKIYNNVLQLLNPKPKSYACVLGIIYDLGRKMRRLPEYTKHPSIVKNMGDYKSLIEIRPIENDTATPVIYKLSVLASMIYHLDEINPVCEELEGLLESVM